MFRGYHSYDIAVILSFLSVSYSSPYARNIRLRFPCPHYDVQQEIFELFHLCHVYYPSMHCTTPILRSITPPPLPPLSNPTAPSGSS